MIKQENKEGGVEMFTRQKRSFLLVRAVEIIWLTGVLTGVFSSVLAGTGDKVPGAAGILVEDGQPKGCIVIPEGTKKGPVLTAVNDLARYIFQMSGAQIPILSDTIKGAGYCIFVGSTKMAPVAPSELTEEKVGIDGFIIRSVPNGVVIAGPNAKETKSTAHGVYHFAEEVLDIHWFSLEDAGPSCPKRTTIHIPVLDLTIKPDFAWRGQYYTIVAQYLPEESLSNRENWGTFNRANGIDAYETYHAFAQFVPDSLFDTHPEYFPLLKGKRTRSTPGAVVQRCLSNPDVLKLAIRYTREIFKKNPELRFASLSGEDGFGWCECEDCKAMGTTPSYRSLAFCNAVAAANETDYPTRGYMFLAYQDTLEPPLEMRAHRNVVPVIAPIIECRIHSIFSDCPDCIRKRRVYSGWQKVAGRISWYGYLNGGPFTGPGVITHAEEARFVRDCGSIGGLREHTGAPQSNWAMLNWVEVKLMWDVDQDPVKLRRQFIKGYYGRAAADAVEKVYDSLEKDLRVSSIAPRNEDTYGHNFVSSAVLKPFIERCRDDIYSALDAVQSEPRVFQERVRRDMQRFLD